MKAKNFTRFVRFMSALLVLGGFSAILAPSALQAQVDLQVLSVTHMTPPLVPGTVETFRIVVDNNGGGGAQDPTVHFLLYDLGFVMDGTTGAHDPDWYFYSSGGTFVRQGNMPNNATETLEFTVYIPSDAAFNSSGILADAVYASIQSATVDPNYANNEATSSLTVQAQSTLTIDKKLLTPNVAPGGYALYEISIRNLGPSDIGGIAALDVPGANLVGPAVLSPNSFNLHIPANDARSVFASVLVDPAAPVGASFSNTASIGTGGAVGGAGTTTAPSISAAGPDTDGTGIVANALPNADLEVVSVTHTSGPWVPGTLETVEVTIRNNGAAAASGVLVLVDVLDTDEFLDTWAWPNNNWYSLGDGVFSRSNAMPAGATETFTLAYRSPSNSGFLAGDPIGGIYSKVSAINPDPNINNNYKDPSIDSRAEATLTLTKTLLTPQVAPGGTALYELTVCNNGPSDIRGIQLLDVPGANLDAGTLVLSADAANMSIAAGTCVDITASVRVSASAPIGASFGNGASLSAATATGGAGTNLAPAVTLPAAVSNNIGVVIAALPAADVQVLDIRLTTGPIVPGTIETFEVDVINNGPSVAYGAIINDVVLNFNGTVVNGPGGPWLSQSNGNSFARSTPMPVGVTETIFFDVLVDANMHYYTNGAPANFAIITSSNPDPNAGNNGLSEFNLPTRAEASLTIDKTLLTPQVAQGGTALYEVTVCNNGPSDIDGIDILDVPGANLVAGSQVLGAAALGIYIPDGECRSALVSARVDPAAVVGSIFANTASVSLANINDGPGTNQAPVVNAPTDFNDVGVVVAALPAADVEVVSVTYNSSPLVPGTTESFTFTVRNNGPADAVGAQILYLLADVAEDLDGGLYDPNWFSPGDGSIARTNPMPAGAVESFTVNLRIPADGHYSAADPIGAFYTQISASNTDINIANNFITLNVDTRAEATLTLDKRLLTPQVAPGGTALYELTVCNNGPSDIRGIQLLDVPGANLDAGTLVLSADAANLTINAGDCVEVLASVRVSTSAPIGSNFVNGASLSAATANGGNGSNLAPVVTLPAAVSNNIGVVIDALPAADVAIIAIRHPNSPVVPGMVERFEVDIRNNGAAPAYGVVLNNLLLNMSGTVVNGPTGAWVSQSDGNSFARSIPMPPNVTETVFFEIQVDGNAHYQTAGGPSYWATVTSSSPDPNTSNNTATLGLQSQVQATLTIDKKLITPQVSQGGTAFYEIEVCNQGPSDVWGVSVTDVLGANLVAGSLVLGPNADNLYIPADGCVVVTATATVNPAAAVGSNFGNTASVNIAALNDGWTSQAPVVNAPSDSDNSGVVIAALPAADVAITSVTLAGGGPIVPGSIATFNITAVNNGPADALGAQLTTLLFDAAYIRNNSSTPSGWNIAGSGGTWTRQTAWPSGQPASFSIEVIIPSDAHYTAGLAIDDFRASISAANPDPVTGNNSQTIFFGCQPQATLSIEKTLLTPVVAPGGTALYEISICNDGPSDIDELAINDIPGLNLNGGTLVLSADASDIYIPAGECRDIMASVQVNASAVPGQNFVNQVNVVTAGVDNGAGATLAFVVNAPTDNATGLVGDYLPAADIDVVTAPVVPLTTPIVAGQVYSFELYVRNNGPAPAEGVTVNNTFGYLPGNWQLVQQPAQSPWSSNSHGISATRIGAMPVGLELVGTYQVVMPADAVTHGFFPGIFIQEVSATADNPDPAPFNNLAFTTRAIQNRADLSIVKRLLTPNVSQGGTALYAIEVTNNGPSDAENISISDVVTGSAGAAVFGEANNFYVSAGESRTVLVTVTVDDNAVVGSTITNCATVNVPAGTIDPNLSNNGPSCVSFEVSPALPVADVAVTDVRLVGPGPIVPGNTYTFEMDVVNNGPADAYGATLAAILYDIDYIIDNSGGDSDWTFGNGVWSRLTAWASGQTETLFITVKVPSDAHYTANDNFGPFWAQISAANPDGALSNNSRSLFFGSQAEADLNIQKTLLTPTVAPGGTALYEITICNEGPSDIDGISLNDVPGLNLDPLTTVISADAFSMYIAAGQCVDVLVSVQVALTAVPGSTFVNEACIEDENVNDGAGASLPFFVSYGDDIQCDEATGDVIDALPPTDLEVVSLTLGTGPVVPGTSETFDVVVRNNGPTPAYGATVTLQFNDINWSVDNDATSPDWSFVGNGTWVRTTAMPAGETATFSIDVAVPADAAYASADGLGPMWVFIAAANPDPITANNGNSLDFATQVQAALSIEKELLTPEVAPGGTALFEITVCNSGPSDINGIGVDDIVGTNLNGATLVLSPDASSMYIPAGQCVDVLAAVRVSDAAAVGQIFCNVAEIDLTNVDGGNGSTMAPLVTTNPVSDEACGTVGDYLPVADVDIAITSLTPDPVATGGLLNFSFTVTNNGPAPAEHVIAHALLLGTQYTLVSNAVPTPWTLTSSGLTLSRSGSMPSGASETLYFVVEIPVCEEIGTNALYVSASAANPDPDLFNIDVLGFNIVDNTPPVIVCPPSITVGTDVDKCSAVVTYSIPVLFDDCFGETVELTDGPASGGVFPLGTTTVEYTAYDLGENETTCTFTVTVMDMQTPTAVCQDITIYLDANGNATIVPSDVDGGSTDNCQLDSALDLEISESSFDCDEVGDNNVTLTVTDAAGNTSICVAEVTVVDNLIPTFTCPADVTVDGCNDLIPDVITGITDEADNCGVASVTQDPVAGLDFGQTNGNSVIITVSVTDVNGNVATCEVEVIINDDDEPDFLNCPTSMIMIGNDPDQCSGKVNWQPPVAVDDCIPLPISAPGQPAPGTVVQTTGPAPGSIVAITCPPTPTTITYIATDGAGNTSSCTFQVMVVDTEEPEFDADITMPNDTVVNCHQVPSNCVYHGPLVCTPLTNNDVNDNCTSPQNLVITYTEVSTQCTNQAQCCYYDYDLTRTWTVTDCAGNKLIHVQEIEVQDTTRPVALCKNITVTLDKSGRVVITPADINNGSFDNCAAPQFLTYTISKSVFTCIDLGDNVVTLTVTDPCGNFSTCTAIVTVVEGIGMCTPAYTVKTNCLDNATTLDNGQFEDIITVKALAMQTWRLTANNGGLFTATSPAPPAAGVVMPVGTLFTAGTADGIDNDGDGQVDEADEMIFYTLRGRFTECVGYTISLSNSTNFGNAAAQTTSTISNKACYPTPYFINLDGPFCLSTPPFAILVGEYNNAAGTVINYMVNGVPTNIFDAGALGEGFHTVMATFDAGTATQNLVINGVQVGGSMADAIADPGCKQKITKIVQVTGTPTTVACNDLINISLDSSCVAVVFPDMVLEGTYYCFDDYTVTLTYPPNTTQFTPPNRVNATHINKVVSYTLSHIISGNMCWGTVKVEDKLAPKLTCPPDLTIACSESTAISHTGNVGIQDCSATTTQVDNVIQDNGDCSNPRHVITRTFIVTDAWGNQAACTQIITVEPFDLNDVIFPDDITLNCEDVNSNPGATLPSATGNPSINGASVTGSVLCDAKVNYTDTYYDGCEGTYTILRVWSVLSDCLPVDPNIPNPISYTQRIEVEDVGGPVFSCPDDVTVSVDPFTCCATAALPDVIISEGCSNILDLEAKVTGVDPNTGNITTFTVPGSLADFPGNNYWNPDTLAVFLFTQCLPNSNTYNVSYTAADQCGNTSSCDFSLTVMDLVPPAVACDEFTQVSLGSDGRIIVNATTFDDGTYDNCCLEGFEVARMIDGPCDQDTIADEFAPTVEFCCADLGDTVTVVFRAYDCTGNTNDCMVQVYVDDKLKPVCSAPANVTVSCENFDPSLWAYGAATATDNCCMDTITSVTILTNFDTTCNRGTITRRFTAVDCAGQTSTCTQRIVVNYEQDYYVRFPNDKILYACDSSFFDQPTFFGEDCELLAVSYHDDLFTVVPDACYKIERTWTIINWCTHNPNLDCIYVPNPNPNVNVNSSQNLPGPIVSAPGTTGPWAPTVVRINPTDPQPTNFSTFWDANANCYVYKQIIKVIDNQDPVVLNCPASPVEVCDLTPNDNLFWNESYWWDNTISSHDLCEAPTDLTITATDSCGGENVNIRYLLFLDLDQDGTMETVISSTNLPGYNNVQFGNAANPNFGGGTPRAFDNRPVSFNQKYGFALQTTTNLAAQTKTASVRWNTTQSPNTYAVPQLPYGTHKIKWIVEDGCGNETVCEYTFVVKDCKAPTVVCINGLSANIMPTDMIVLWASDFLQYTEDNCTPTDQIKVAIRRKGAGTGFPTNPDGTPQTSVTFTCADLGTQFVELWGQDAAGNADYCETYVIVQDNAGNCSNSNVTVAGELQTMMQEGLQDAEVELNGMHPALPPINMFEQSVNDGSYMFGNALPVAANYTVTPTKDDDHLNGVSTFDLVLINKHILGIESFDSPFKIIAADANNSKSVTTFDIAEIRKLILGIYTELPNNTSWRFVDDAYAFPNPDNPFTPAFPESKSVADVQANQLGDDFVAMKIGDVNGSAIANSLVTVDDRTNGTLLFDLEDRKVKAGETVTVNFTAAEKVTGYQFTLGLAGLEVVDIVPGEGMKAENFAVFADAITTSFDANVEGAFAVTFRAKQAGSLRNMLSVSSRITKSEAYSLGGDRLEVALRFNGKNVQGVGFEVYQNQPNPWVNRTIIGFHLPEATEATLNVYDETGRLLFNQTGDFAKGHNAFTLDKALVNTTGVLYYQVSTSEHSATMKMIQTK